MVTNTTSLLLAALCATPQTGSSLWTWSTLGARGWTSCRCCSTRGSTRRAACARARLPRRSSRWCIWSKVSAAHAATPSVPLWSNVCVYRHRAVLQRGRADAERALLFAADVRSAGGGGGADAEPAVQLKPVRTNVMAPFLSPISWSELTVVHLCRGFSSNLDSFLDDEEPTQV